MGTHHPLILSPHHTLIPGPHHPFILSLSKDRRILKAIQPPSLSPHHPLILSLSKDRHTLKAPAKEHQWTA